MLIFIRIPHILEGTLFFSYYSKKKEMNYENNHIYIN